MKKTERISIRLPSDVHQRLQKAADRDSRDKSKQALYYILRGLKQDEEALRPSPALPAPGK